MTREQLERFRQLSKKWCNYRASRLEIHELKKLSNTLHEGANTDDPLEHEWVGCYMLRLEKLVNWAMKEWGREDLMLEFTLAAIEIAYTVIVDDYSVLSPELRRDLNGSKRHAVLTAMLHGEKVSTADRIKYVGNREFALQVEKATKIPLHPDRMKISNPDVNIALQAYARTECRRKTYDPESKAFLANRILFYRTKHAMHSGVVWQRLRELARYYYKQGWLDSEQADKIFGNVRRAAFSLAGYGTNSIKYTDGFKPSDFEGSAGFGSMTDTPAYATSPEEQLISKEEGRHPEQESSDLDIEATGIDADLGAERVPEDGRSVELKDLDDKDQDQIITADMEDHATLNNDDVMISVMDDNNIVVTFEKGDDISESMATDATSLGCGMHFDAPKLANVRKAHKVLPHKLLPKPVERRVHRSLKEKMALGIIKIEIDKAWDEQRLLEWSLLRNWYSDQAFWESTDELAKMFGVSFATVVNTRAMLAYKLNNTFADLGSDYKLPIITSVNSEELKAEEYKMKRLRASAKAAYGIELTKRDQYYINEMRKEHAEQQKAHFVSRGIRMP